MRPRLGYEHWEDDIQVQLLSHGRVDGLQSMLSVPQFPLLSNEREYIS